MKSHLELCTIIRENLDRDLQEKEKEFLQWVYVRYEEEQPKKKTIYEIHN